MKNSFNTKKVKYLTNRHGVAMESKGVLEIMTFTIIFGSIAFGWFLNEKLTNNTKIETIEIPVVEYKDRIITEKQYVCEEKITSVWQYGKNNQLDYQQRNSIKKLECKYDSFSDRTYCSFFVDGEASVVYANGNSMLPCSLGTGLNSKSLILKSDDIQLGDFIYFYAFDNKTHPIIHQVVGINKTMASDTICYITQGLNNVVTDQDRDIGWGYQCIKPENIVGREIVIFRDGVAG